MVVAAGVLEELPAGDTLSPALAPMRVVTVSAPGATPAINADVTDLAIFTGVATAITSMTTNLTGTPVDGQQLLVRFKDAGTAKAIAWGASYVASGAAALLATTIASKTHTAAFIWDAAVSKWVGMAMDFAGY